jgi:hypothetical protein
LQKSKGTQSKAAFVRAQGSEGSAADVVKKAKDNGITITAQRVYAIRSALRKKKGTTRKLASAAPISDRLDDQESQRFVAVVASIGLLRAERLLADVRAKITGIKLAR